MLSRIAADAVVHERRAIDLVGAGVGAALGLNPGCRGVAVPGEAAPVEGVHVVRIGRVVEGERVASHEGAPATVHLDHEAADGGLEPKEALIGVGLRGGAALHRLEALEVEADIARLRMGTL